MAAAVESAFLELPPPPEPLHVKMRKEACRGCALVLFIIIVLVSIVHGTVYAGAQLRPGSESNWLLVWFIYIEAGVALYCLAELMWGDPGVITRSLENVVPVPPIVMEKLRAGESLSDLHNIVEGNASYCVRCCIWRRPTPGSTISTAHHCSTCNCCVDHFDHHCGVFGRCIAGKLRWGQLGNLVHFYLIQATGVVAMLTALTSVALFTGYWLVVFLAWPACSCISSVFFLACRFRSHFTSDDLEARVPLSDTARIGAKSGPPVVPPLAPAIQLLTAPEKRQAASCYNYDS